MRLPDHESRTFIAGATGSGKTRFGTWLFGKTFRPKHRPYTIIDTKREPLFAEIDRAIEIDPVVPRSSAAIEAAADPRQRQ